MNSKVAVIFVRLSLASSFAAASPADEAKQIAVDAYIYGYPLVTVEYTRRALTNFDKIEGTRAPMGQLARLRQYPTPSVQSRDGAQRRYALCHRFYRCRQGALGSEPA
jgi:hypothetical protein